MLGIAGLALVFTALSSASSLPVALVLVTVGGAFEGPVLTSTLTVRELHSPASMRTQVVMTAASLKFAGYALGSAVAGHVVAASGAVGGLRLVTLCQLGGLLVGALALGWPTLRRRFLRR
jgi:hypothetical protein